MSKVTTEKHRVALSTHPLIAGLVIALGGGTIDGLARDASISPIALQQSLRSARLPHITPSGSKQLVSYAVTDCLDNNNPTSLRNVVAMAPEGSTIDLTGLQCSKITLTQGAIWVPQNNLTLSGPGADKLAIDGGASYGYGDRVFFHYGTGTFKINNLTIADAINEGAVPQGGCINSYGSVTLQGSTVTGCTIAPVLATNWDALGGGIYARGDVRLYASKVIQNTLVPNGSVARGGGVFAGGAIVSKYSAIADNVAKTSVGFVSKGGGLVAAGNNNVFIYGSTISGNKATNDAGIYVSCSVGPYVLDITNSTISGNQAYNYTGGGWSCLPTTIANSTIAFNRASSLVSATGFYAYATLDAESSIFANNSNAWGDENDVSTSSGAVSGDKNLIVYTTNTVPLYTISLCPHLAPLLDNGGLTRTHALLAGSPAIDVGSNTKNLQGDQRGPAYPRSFGAATDIGSFEWQGGSDDVLFTSQFDSRCN